MPGFHLAKKEGGGNNLYIKGGTSGFQGVQGFPNYHADIPLYRLLWTTHIYYHIVLNEMHGQMHCHVTNLFAASKLAYITVSQPTISFQNCRYNLTANKLHYGPTLSLYSTIAMSTLPLSNG